MLMSYNVVVLVGMRYCGKSTLGRHIASCIPSSEFIDVDTCIIANYNQRQTTTSTSPPFLLAENCGDIVDREGWSYFRELEFNTMNTLLSLYTGVVDGGVARNKRHLLILACGGGFVEHTPSLELVQGLSRNSSSTYFQVYYMDKPLSSLLRDKQHAEERGDGVRPAYQRQQGVTPISTVVPFEEVRKRRVPLYESIMTHRLSIGDNEPVENTVNTLMGLLVRGLGRTATSQVSFGRFRRCLVEPQVRQSLRGHRPRNTHFVTLSRFPGGPSQWRCVSSLAALVDECALGCDTLEVRLDMLLTCPPKEDKDAASTGVSWEWFHSHYIPEAHALLQAITAAAPSLCVLATYRTHEEGGVGVDSRLIPSSTTPFLQVFWEALWEYSMGGGRAHRDPSQQWCSVDAIDIELLSTQEGMPIATRASPFLPFQGGSAASANPFPIVSVHDMVPASSANTDLLTERRDAFATKVSKLLAVVWGSLEGCLQGDEDDVVGRISAIPKYVGSATMFPTCHSPLPRHQQNKSLHQHILDIAGFAHISSPLRRLLEWLVVAVTTAGIPPGDDVEGLPITRDDSLSSRALNCFHTPVTHPVLASVGAPGQVSLVDLNRARRKNGDHSISSYTLFGSPITSSKSPLIHNHIFQNWLGVGDGGKYSLYETDASGDAVSEAVGREGWVGGSVTIPLKEAITTNHRDVIVCSEDAVEMGATNTLCRVGTALMGYNTDWVALRDALLDRIHKNTLAAISSELKTLRGDRPTASYDNCVEAVVFGAGGTARCAIYTALQMFEANKLRIVIVNRTVSKAEEVRDSFMLGVKGASDAEWIVLGSATPPSQPIIHNNFPSRLLLVNTVPKGPGIAPLVATYAAWYISRGGQQHPSPLVADFAYVASGGDPEKSFMESLGVHKMTSVLCGCIEGKEILIRQAMYQQLLWWRAHDEHTLAGDRPARIRSGVASVLAAPYFPLLPVEMVGLLQ